MLTVNEEYAYQCHWLRYAYEGRKSEQVYQACANIMWHLTIGWTTQ